MESADEDNIILAHSSCVEHSRLTPSQAGTRDRVGYDTHDWGKPAPIVVSTMRIIGANSKPSPSAALLARDCFCARYLSLGEIMPTSLSSMPLSWPGKISGAVPKPLLVAVSAVKRLFLRPSIVVLCPYAHVIAVNANVMERDLHTAALQTSTLSNVGRDQIRFKSVLRQIVFPRLIEAGRVHL